MSLDRGQVGQRDIIYKDSKGDCVIPVLSIPVLNRYDLLDESLSSIDFPVREVLIINNGLQEYIPKRTDLNIRVLNLPSNLGMSGSWNLTIKLYPHEKYWVFSSADTFWLPGSLEKLYEISNESSLLTSNHGFSCFSIGEDVVRQVGLFDEHFYPYLFEDDDYRERLFYIMKQKRGRHLTFDNVKFEVITPHGPAQTIESDKKLANRYGETRLTNEKYYRLKQSQKFEIPGSWDLDVRRANEWL
jgi:glycosyltransferase involved in cell wall biosynthesis